MKNPETAIRLYDAWLTHMENRDDDDDENGTGEPEPLKAGFIYQYGEKLLARIADDVRVETCRIWADEKALGYSCSCRNEDFCDHAAQICVDYFTGGGEPAMSPEAFLKAFGENSIPDGAVKYQLDHFADGGFPADEDGDEPDDEDEDEDGPDEEDGDDEEDGEDDWDELEDPDDDESDEDDEESAGMEDIAAQRRKAGLCRANSLALLRERLQADGAGLASGLMLALAEQDERFRLRLLHTLGLGWDNGPGADQELLSAFLEDAVNPAPWPFYQADDPEPDIEFTDDAIDFPDRFMIVLKAFRELIWRGGDKTALAVLRRALTDPENRGIVEFIALDHAGQFQMQALTLLQG